MLLSKDRDQPWKERIFHRVMVKIGKVEPTMEKENLSRGHGEDREI